MGKIVEKYFIVGNANEDDKSFLETAVEDYWSGLIKFSTREEAEEYINTTLAGEVEGFDRDDWEIAEVESIIKRGV